MKIPRFLPCFLSLSGLLHGQTTIDGGTHVTVPGTHASPWNIYPAGLLLVGDSGAGTLSVNSGAKVYSDTAFLGNGVGSTGIVNVSGTGTLWNLLNETTTEGENGLIVGKLGNGTLNISGGAEVDSDGWISIGYGDSSGTGTTGTGLVTVSGAGSKLTGAASLRLGRYAGSSGNLTVSNGGNATITTGISISGATGGTNSWLTVETGGSVTTGNLSTAGGATNGVRVTGENSTLNVGSQLSAGLNTKFHIENGALVSVGTNLVVNAGDMSVTGTSTRLAVTGAAVVSTGTGSNNGRLNVGNGASVTIGSAMTLGPQANNNGAVSITGGGTVTVEGNTSLGTSNSATAALTVSGTGSTYTGKGTTFSVGSTSNGGTGSGTVTVADGGTVISGATGTGTLTLNHVNSTLNVGTSGAAGTVQAANVGGASGRGKVNFNHTGTTTFAANITGGFQLTVNKSGSGTTILTGASTYSGATTISEGRIVNNGSLGATDISVANGALYGGNGTHTGSLTVQSGGTITPGASVGILNTRSLNLIGQAIYQWEISDAAGTAGTGWDLIQITGSATIGSTEANPFTLELLKAGTLANFDPSENYIFTIATAGTAINGFSTDRYEIDASAIPESSAGSWSLGQSGNSLVLSYTAVPEPSAAALAALGLLSALRRRRSH